MTPPDRWDRDKHLPVAVLAPSTTMTWGIDVGSAIVARLDELDAQPAPTYVICDYEGGRYQSLAFREKLSVAAGRLVTRYPTIARSALPRDELVVVAHYTPGNGALTVLDAEVLRAWTGREF